MSTEKGIPLRKYIYYYKKTAIWYKGLSDGKVCELARANNIIVEIEMTKQKKMCVAVE